MRAAGHGLLCVALLLTCGNAASRVVETAKSDAVEVSALAMEEPKGDYIHWVEFSIPLETMEQALAYDMESYGQEPALNWIDLLAYAAAKTGGVFKSGKRSPAIDELVKRLREGEELDAITDGMKFFQYYQEAYTAVLGAFVGEGSYGDGKTKKRGLAVYSPIARGYGFGHYDDFGAARTYGYKRLHLGNDLCGAIGTPIIAVEGGVVTALGWNEYGGWRVGIRSHDSLRYYYYAHMRKDHPYVKTLREGDTVQAGDVIGYMGMTGYSRKENVNNINVPHLHFGLQLIFDESQAEGPNQIWIDVYDIVRLLERRRMPVQKSEETGEYTRADEGAA